LTRGVCALLLAPLATLHGAEAEHPADWLKDAQLGVFMQFLPFGTSGPRQLSKVNEFDVPALVRQLKTMGGRYFVFTLGQTSGIFNAPNAAWGNWRTIPLT
jgi:hypothetical protein